MVTSRKDQSDTVLIPSGPVLYLYVILLPSTSDNGMYWRCGHCFISAHPPTLLEPPSCPQLIIMWPCSLVIVFRNGADSDPNWANWNLSSRYLNDPGKGSETGRAGAGQSSHQMP